MESDRFFNKPEGDFIPGIYNYCNRWCERCPYTDKCRVFADEKIFMREIEKKERLERSMEENKEFWDQINKTIEEAAELIDEEVPLVKNEPLSELWDSDDDDDDELSKEYEEKRERAENHELSKVALKYEKAVSEWFKDQKDILKLDFIPETRELKVSYPGITSEEDVKQLTDAVEVIQWYHIQIWVKMNRALTSLYEEEEEPEMFKDFPKDSEGTARVILMGIDSSIGSWNYLLKKIEPERETIKSMIRMLVWLRIEVEKLFPDARDFEWPPKV